MPEISRTFQMVNGKAVPLPAGGGADPGIAARVKALEDRFDPEGKPIALSLATRDTPGIVRIGAGLNITLAAPDDADSEDVHDALPIWTRESASRPMRTLPKVTPKPPRRIRRRATTPNRGRKRPPACSRSARTLPPMPTPTAGETPRSTGTSGSSTTSRRNCRRPTAWPFLQRASKGRGIGLWESPL